MYFCFKSNENCHFSFGKTVTTQNGLLIFLGKETHSETKSWKSSRILRVNSNFFIFSFFHIFPFFHFSSFFISFFLFLSLSFFFCHFHSFSIMFFLSFFFFFFFCFFFSFVFFPFFLFLFLFVGGASKSDFFGASIS